MADKSSFVCFGPTYAGIYDGLYGDKNYATEAKFVLQQFQKILSTTPLNILDLGCGTGLHALEIAKTKISVTGVDRSADMVAIAEKRRKMLPRDLSELLDFKIGDICTIDLHRRYDAIFSLFHVMSYLVVDSDLEAAFQTAQHHLQEGGVFMFDFWYGPAILNTPPRPRVKTVKVGNKIIKRKTIPECDLRRHIVRVNYDIEIANITSGETIRAKEQHVMRYYFSDEINDRLAMSGFEIARMGEWMTGRIPTDNTFSVFALVKLK